MSTLYNHSSHMNVSYHVRPRYTPGSGAMVDWRTAEKVRDEESAAYHDAINNPSNPDHEKAKKLGQGWIVWSSWELHGFYHRYDETTGERTKVKLKPGESLPQVPEPVWP